MVPPPFRAEDEQKHERGHYFAGNSVEQETDGDRGQDGKDGGEDRRPQIAPGLFPPEHDSENAMP
jgi:hypothetical protein